MANTIKNLGGVTKELLYQLTNEMSVMKGVKRQYSDQFAREGAKIGDTLNVKYLDNVPVTRGPVAVVQDVVEKTLPIQITNAFWYQTSISFGDLEYKLSIEEFDEKTNLKQIVAKMANEMEQDILNLVLGVPNMVGTLGTTPGTAGGAGLLMTTSPNIFGNAGAILTDLGAPIDSRTMALTTMGMSLSAAATVALQNPTQDISNQYRKGRVTTAMNFEFMENVNIPSIITGTRANGTMQLGSVDGATTISVQGLGANATISAGEHLTIANVLAVNPMNQQIRSFLRQFVVTSAATANAAGVATLNIYPALSLSNPETLVGGVLTRRYPFLPINVNGTVNALPLAGAAVTFSGIASTTGVLNLAHQRDAIVLTSVDLPLYGGADKCVQQRFEGITLRVWQDGDIINSRRITRIDAVVVPTLVRPDLACVVFG